MQNGAPSEGNRPGKAGCTCDLMGFSTCLPGRYRRQPSRGPLARGEGLAPRHRPGALAPETRRVTCPPQSTFRGPWPAPAAGQRPPHHARRGGPARPSQWAGGARRPRAGGRAWEAGRARTPPPGPIAASPPRREVSCPGRRASAPGRGSRRSPRAGRSMAAAKVSVSRLPRGARGPPRACTCRVDAPGDAPGKERGAAGPPCSGARREVTAAPAQHRRPARAPRPDPAAETWQGPLPLGPGAESAPDRRPAGSAGPARRSRCARGGGGPGVRVPGATPARSGPRSRCRLAGASPSWGRSAGGRPVPSGWKAPPPAGGGSP